MIDVAEGTFFALKREQTSWVNSLIIKAKRMDLVHVNVCGNMTGSMIFVRMNLVGFM